MESLLEDVFKRKAQTCTHTHTCNPPGPDYTHTHTCYHRHTQIISKEEANQTSDNAENSVKNKKRPAGGNREAVRKYREKKKAHTAYLEEEVQKLRSINQTLLKRLQRQTALENEIANLRSVLFEMRDKIDTELGPFPYQNLQPQECSTQFVHETSNLRGQDRCRDIQCPSLATSTSRVFRSQDHKTTKFGTVLGRDNADCQFLKVVTEFNCPSLNSQGTLAAEDCEFQNGLSPGNLASSSGNGSA